jgi:hypothetical protein
MITQDQMTSVVRWVITAVAAGIAGWLGISQGHTDVAVSVIVPALAALCWGLYVHSPNSTIKAAERNLEPGEKIVVNSQAKADELAPRDASGEPVHDKILSPEEDLAHVANQQGVVVTQDARVVSPAPRSMKAIEAAADALRKLEQVGKHPHTWANLSGIVKKRWIDKVMVVIKAYEESKT